jgi:uncharacterized protein YhfF
MISQQMTNDADRYWMQYVQSLPDDVEPPERYVEAFSFGFSPAEASEIAELVLNETKTATGSVLWSFEYDKKPAPRVGDYWIVQDGRGMPVCIIQTTDVSIIPFDEVSASYAWEGGEGDRTLESWRSIYWRFIVAECERIGREPNSKAPLIMERFVVEYSEPLR